MSGASGFDGTHTTAGPDSNRRLHIGYGVGGIVAGAFATVVGLMLLPYLTDTLGTGPGLAGVILLGVKAWEIVVSPLAGRISDRTRSRSGPRRPYLLIGGCALGGSLAVTFAAPAAGPAGAGYLIAALLAAGAAFACYQAPYAAMPAELTDSPAERTQLMTWRVAFLAAASLVTGALAPVVVSAGGGGTAGYRWMGVFVGGLVAVGAIGSFGGTASAPTGRAYPTETSLRRQFAAVRECRPFRALLSCFVLQSVGIGSLLAGLPYFADHVLDDHGATPVLFAGFVGPALVVMPVWSAVGRRVGKRAAYTAGSLLLAAASAALVAAPVMPPAAVYPVVVAAGVGYAGLQVFAQAMLPDCIAADAAHTGRQQAGVFGGLWTAGQTLGLAVGPLLFGLILQVTGYRPSTTGTAAPQPPAAEVGLLLGYAALPALVVAAAVLLLRGYDHGPASGHPPLA